MAKVSLHVTPIRGPKVRKDSAAYVSLSSDLHVKERWQPRLPKLASHLKGEEQNCSLVSQEVLALTAFQ